MQLPQFRLPLAVVGHTVRHQGPETGGVVTDLGVCQLVEDDVIHPLDTGPAEAEAEAEAVLSGAAAPPGLCPGHRNRLKGKAPLLRQLRHPPGEVVPAQAAADIFQDGGGLLLAGVFRQEDPFPNKARNLPRGGGLQAVGAVQQDDRVPRGSLRSRCRSRVSPCFLVIQPLFSATNWRIRLSAICIGARTSTEASGRI